MSVEITKNIAEQVAIPTEIVSLELSGNKSVAFLDIKENDEQAYGQLTLLTKEAKQIDYASTSKMGILIIPSLIENAVLIKKYINPDYDAETLVVKVNFGKFAKLRISVKNTGTSVAKVSLKQSFYDRDLSGMVINTNADGSTYQYIYGTEDDSVETGFTKRNNTKIARLVKDLFEGDTLYSDANKKGFHKAVTRMPADNLIRTNDNYSFYFIWDEIAEKVGQEGVAKILEVIKTVYPNLEVSTETPLYIECTKSLFKEITSEKLIFENGEIISKAEKIAAEKEAKAAEKAAEKEAKVAAKAAEKAEKEAAKEAEKAAKLQEKLNAKSESVVAGIAPVVPSISPAVAPAAVAPAAPAAVAPAAVAPVAPSAVAPAVTPVAPSVVAPVAPAAVAPAAVTPVVPNLGNLNVEIK